MDLRVVESALPRSKFKALAWLFCLVVGCKSEAPDVLREFPPPRLAKVAPNQTQRLRTLMAQCDGDVVVRTRTAATTLRVREAHGSFTLTGRMKDGLDATLFVELPPELGEGGPATKELTWRVLDVRPSNDGEGAFAGVDVVPGLSPNPSPLSIVAQVEYNRVRTQNVHSLVFESEDSATAPHKVHLLRLALDPSAHRLRFPPETSIPAEVRATSWATSTVRKVELNLHCALSETEQSER